MHTYTNLKNYEFFRYFFKRKPTKMNLDKLSEVNDD